MRYVGVEYFFGYLGYTSLSGVSIMMTLSLPDEILVIKVKIWWKKISHNWPQGKISYKNVESISTKSLPKWPPKWRPKAALGSKLVKMPYFLKFLVLLFPQTICEIFFIFLTLECHKYFFYYYFKWYHCAIVEHSNTSSICTSPDPGYSS